MDQNFLNMLSLVSFAIQVKNNEELHKQSTNDEIQSNLHEDIMQVLETNSKLFNIIIKQNKEILELLRKENVNEN